MSVASRSWFISLAIHLCLAAIIGVYLVTQSQSFKDLMGVEIFEPVNPPPKPQVRRPVIKPVQRPEPPVENTVTVEQIKVQPRRTNATVVRTATVQPRTVSAFSSQSLKLNAPVNSNVPPVVNSNVSMPQVVTHTDVPVSDAPDALSSPVITGAGENGEHISHGIGGGRRGVSGGTVQVRITDVFRLPLALAMVKEVGADREALDAVVDGIMLGNLEVPPLPRGEPGGHVVGRGRDIRGVFRFTRLRHDLSDWWTDASALNAWAKWLNEKTRIRTDMNVEGGALKLTDANVMKSPILIMTGHNPALMKSAGVRALDTGRIIRSIRGSQFSQLEGISLRRYLVEKEGFLIFDDCGTEAAAQSMTRLFLTNMRYIMPEYQVGRIPNNHDIYHNFYQMGGPPIGFDIYHPGRTIGFFLTGGRLGYNLSRNFLEGIFIDDKLSVLIVRRDYMCAMESISLPSRSVHYSPGVYRFMTNVAIYALTHGKISDYSSYIPEDKSERQKFPSRAPQAASIGAVE